MKNTWKRSIHSYPFRRMSGKSRTLTCAPYVWKNRAMWLSCVDMARVLNVHLHWRFAPCAENPSIKRLRCSIDVNVRSWWPLGFLTRKWISLSWKCWCSAAFDWWSCLSMYREHTALFNCEGNSKFFEALAGLHGLCGKLSARMTRTFRFLGAFEMCEITGGLFCCSKCPSKESL